MLSPGTRAEHQDRISPVAFEAMRRIVVQMDEPLQFLKVIHVGGDKRDFEEAVKRSGFPVTALGTISNPKFRGSEKQIEHFNHRNARYRRSLVGIL